MNFKAWLKKLKRETRSLPLSEQRTVVSYYEELYYDKKDEGYTEREIVREFGAPELAAGKILSETYGGVRVREKKLSGTRIFCFLVIGILLGIPIIAVVFSLWVTAFALVVSGIGISLGGIWGIVTSVAAIISGGPWMAYLGISLFLIGFGIIFAIVMIQLSKAFWRATKACFHWLGRVLRPMEVRR